LTPHRIKKTRERQHFWRQVLFVEPRRKLRQELEADERGLERAAQKTYNGQMRTAALVSGSLAMLLIFAMGAAFLVAPNKANKLLGTYMSQGMKPLPLRGMGFAWMIFALYFEAVIVEKFSK
jgi:hypothetical protein